MVYFIHCMLSLFRCDAWELIFLEFDWFLFSSNHHRRINLLMGILKINLHSTIERIKWEVQHYRILLVNNQWKVNNHSNRLKNDCFSHSGSLQHPSKSSNANNKKPSDNGLCVLGYENIKGTPVHPKIRQELDYLDREVCFWRIIWYEEYCSRFLGTPSCHCLSIWSVEKTRYTFERSGKLYWYFTCENSRTMSDNTSSRSLFIDIISSILTDLSCFH